MWPGFSQCIRFATVFVRVLTAMHIKYDVGTNYSTSIHGINLVIGCKVLIDFILLI